MTSRYWVGDRYGRVMGPASLEMIRELLVRGRLKEIDRGSADGKTWRPIAQVPELHALVVLSPTTVTPAQLHQQATALSAECLRLRALTPRERLGAPRAATVSECQTAFFSTVKRYHSSRLPPNAPPALQDAYIAMAELLGEAMAEVEASATGAGGQRATGDTIRYGTSAFVGWHEIDGVIQVELALSPENRELLTGCDKANLANDGFYLPTQRSLPLLQPVAVRLEVTPFRRQVCGPGRVVAINPPGRVPGLAIRLLSASVEDRRLLRYFAMKYEPTVSAAGSRQGR